VIIANIIKVLASKLRLLGQGGWGVPKEFSRLRVCSKCIATIEKVVTA
jgi:hypothetical protein